MADSSARQICVASRTDKGPERKRSARVREDEGVVSLVIASRI